MVILIKLLAPTAQGLFLTCQATSVSLVVLLAQLRCLAHGGMPAPGPHTGTQWAHHRFPAPGAGQGSRGVWGSWALPPAPHPSLLLPGKETLAFPLVQCSRGSRARREARGEASGSITAASTRSAARTCAAPSTGSVSNTSGVAQGKAQAIRGRGSQAIQNSRT